VSLSIQRVDTGDPVIDSCINYSKAITTDINNLYSELYRGTLNSSDELRERYDAINERIKNVAIFLKPAAYAKCNQMQFEEGAQIKYHLDAAVGGLKKQHKTLLNLIVERLYEDKMLFPMPPLPSCISCRSQRFMSKNAGWIIWGLSASAALLTLTSLGQYIGPALANAPKYFGDTGQAIGEFCTDLLNSKPFQNLYSSSIPTTIGKIALIPTFSYPLYRYYFKNPAEKFFNSVLNQIDRAAVSAAENPMRTFIVSWAVCYLGSRWLGFDGTSTQGWVDPFHTRLALTFFPAAMAPGLAKISKIVIQDYKQSRDLAQLALPPLPPAPKPQPVSLGEHQTERPDPMPKPVPPAERPVNIDLVRAKRIERFAPNPVPVRQEAPDEFPRIE